MNAPDTRIGNSPISRLAEQVAVDPIGFDWNAPRSDMWTNRQAQLRLYKHRFFTKGPGADTSRESLRRFRQLLLSCVSLICPCVCLVEPPAGF